MSRQERKLHKNFVDYQDFIVNHKNYKTLPNKFNSQGEITWVKVKDEERTVWWDRLKEEMNLLDRASVARQIHPPELKGMKPCQVCGEELSINYLYLNANSFEKIRALVPEIKEDRFEYELENLFEIVQKQTSSEPYKLLAKLLGKANLKLSDIKGNQKGLKLTFLSPGVMSNAPDRLDGFHTYNACCRGVQDTGRHKSNLARYSQDRRAYENWADGNWRGANRLIGVYASCSQEVECPGCGTVSKMTADHIGPISLGFCHRMKFKPLCHSCNSSKNNRMTLEDVKKLIKDEENGEQVVSWHTKSVWDKMKFQIKNDNDAINLSVIMRKNLHHILTIFSLIAENNGEAFLKLYLHPEYAKYDYEFANFDPLTGEFKAKKFEVDTKNTQSNAERYIRVSFESLKEYATKENRRSISIKNKSTIDDLENMLTYIRKNDYPTANQKLKKIIEEISTFLVSTP
jgi:Alw26I/Eco31I/Esp3I family type II restriction endonuclease